MLFKSSHFKDFQICTFFVLTVSMFLQSCSSSLEKEKDSTSLDSLMQRSSQYISARNFKGADSVLSLAEVKATSTSDTVKVANIYFNMGLVDYYTNDFNSGIETYDKAAQLYAHILDSNSTSQSYRMKALMNRKQGFTEQAIESFLLAVEFSTEPKVLAGAYMSLGNLYKELKEYDNALETYKKGLVLYETLKSDKNIAIAMNNLGITYHALKNFESAKKHYFLALRIRQDLRDSIGMAPTVLNIGEFYMDIGKEDSALQYLKKALTIEEHTAEKDVSIAANQLLGQLYLNKNDYVKSKVHLDQAKQLLSTYPSLRHALNSSLGYKEFYIKAQNYRQALYWDAKYDSLNAIFFEEQRLKVHDKENNYKIEQERKINAALDKERAFQKEISELRLWAALALGSVLILVVIQLVMYIIRNKKVSELNVKLEAQKETINILSKNNFHFTMNSLDELQSKFAYQASKIDGQSKETLNEVMGSLGTTARLFKNLLKTYDPTKESTGDQDIHQFLNDVIVDTCSVHHLNSDRITRHIEIDHAKFKPKHMYAIGQIVNELITNSAKYAFQDLDKAGKLEVYFLKEKSSITLLVKDDGPGFEGSKKAKETSMGMSLVKILVANLNATCETISTNHGHETRINIPYDDSI